MVGFLVLLWLFSARVHALFQLFPLFFTKTPVFGQNIYGLNRSGHRLSGAGGGLARSGLGLSGSGGGLAHSGLVLNRSGGRPNGSGLGLNGSGEVLSGPGGGLEHSGRSLFCFHLDL